MIGPLDGTLVDPVRGLTADCLISESTVVKRAVLGLGPGIAPACAGDPESGDRQRGLPRSGEPRAGSGCSPETGLASHRTHE